MIFILSIGIYFDYFSNMLEISLLLDNGASYRELTPGEIIFHEGSTPTFYYQIVSGKVRWSNFMANGKEVLHDILVPGESFGEFGIFDGNSYAATTIADTPCKLIRLRAEVFLGLMKQNPDLLIQFNKLFVKRLRFFYFLQNILSSNSPEYILENLIEYYNRNGKHICQECNRLFLTRQQLANISGLRVETVIRTIKNMEREAKVDVVRGKIFIPSDGI